MNFNHKVPLAPSKWLSRRIKMDKWDYYYFRSQDLFFYFYFNFHLFFLNMKPSSEEVPVVLSFRPSSKQCALNSRRTTAYQTCHRKLGILYNSYIEHPNISNMFDLICKYFLLRIHDCIHIFC